MFLDMLVDSDITINPPDFTVPSKFLNEFSDCKTSDAITTSAFNSIEQFSNEFLITLTFIFSKKGVKVCV